MVGHKLDKPLIVSDISCEPKICGHHIQSEPFIFQEIHFAPIFKLSSPFSFECLVDLDFLILSRHISLRIFYQPSRTQTLRRKSFLIHLVWF